MEGRLKKEVDQWRAKRPDCARFNPTAQSHCLLSLSFPTQFILPSTPPVTVIICVPVCVCACINPVFITFSVTLSLAWIKPDEAAM